MDNFIFKGLSSTIFEGLVVNSLPPIVKPNKRVNKTTIDGRDGDIVEFLGYEAYDLPVTITRLSKELDVNEIINWLNGSGQLVLSTEPDKYYKAEVIEQIDFRKLELYEPTKIVFHVQPYKYLYKERKQVFEDLTKSIVIVNVGLEDSTPLIKIMGSGTIEFQLEGITIFTYTFPDDENEVIIDSEKQDAYLGTVLKNRNMIGEFPILKSKKNNVVVNGNVTKLEVEANSCWL